MMFSLQQRMGGAALTQRCSALTPLTHFLCGGIRTTFYSLLSDASNLYSPFLFVEIFITFSLYRNISGIEALDKTDNCCSFPSFHFISNTKPPLAQIPFTSPFAKATGNAGSISIYFVWLCTSISPMPAAPPKFPSIWNGGCASNKFG